MYSIREMDAGSTEVLEVLVGPQSHHPFRYTLKSFHRFGRLIPFVSL